MDQGERHERNLAEREIQEWRSAALEARSERDAARAEVNLLRAELTHYDKPRWVPSSKYLDKPCGCVGFVCLGPLRDEYCRHDGGWIADGMIRMPTEVHYGRE